MESPHVVAQIGVFMQMVKNVWYQKERGINSESFRSKTAGIFLTIIYWLAQMNMWKLFSKCYHSKTRVQNSLVDLRLRSFKSGIRKGCTKSKQNECILLMTLLTIKNHELTQEDCFKMQGLKCQ